MTTLDLMVDVDEIIFPMIDNIHRLALEAGLHDGSIEPGWVGWEVYGCSEQAYWDLWASFADQGGYSITEPYAGSAEALRWLHWQGHRVHLVTARGGVLGHVTNGEDVKEWTVDWLNEFAIPRASLTFTHDKPGAQELLGVEFDFAIDDSPKNWWKLTHAGVYTFLGDHAHNRDDVTIPAERRVKDLWEFAYQIEKLS